MDGTEKLPQRILEPAVHALEHGQPIRPFAFAVAAWTRYAFGRMDDGERHTLRDPRETEIRERIGDGDADDVTAVLHELPSLFPEALRQSQAWQGEVAAALNAMLTDGMAEAIRREAGAT